MLSTKKTMMSSALGAVAMMALMTTPARAQGQPIDARTEFTFNQPVEMPGVTLPAGTYVFRFVDATTGKRVMQVQSKAGNKSYGMFMTINAQRPTAANDAELRFLETPAGQPAAVKSWWYPGNTIGREFIYPKTQARRLAKATNEPVLTTRADNEPTGNMKGGDLAYVSPAGDERELTDDELVSLAANTPPVGDPTASNRVAQEGTMARSTLPKTATPLAGIGLLGLLSLLSGAAIRLKA